VLTSDPRYLVLRVDRPDLLDIIARDARVAIEEVARGDLRAVLLGLAAVEMAHKEQLADAILRVHAGYADPDADPDIGCD
jgi:hypothetical protein